MVSWNEGDRDSPVPPGISERTRLNTFCSSCNLAPILALRSMLQGVMVNANILDLVHIYCLEQHTPDRAHHTSSQLQA